MKPRVIKRLVQIAPMAIPKDLMDRIDAMLVRVNTVRSWEERSKTALIRELLHHGLDAMDGILNAEAAAAEMRRSGVEQVNKAGPVGRSGVRRVKKAGAGPKTEQEGAASETSADGALGEVSGTATEQPAPRPRPHTDSDYTVNPHPTAKQGTGSKSRVLKKVGKVTFSRGSSAQGPETTPRSLSAEGDRATASKHQGHCTDHEDLE